ncbi:formiminotransferase cyclodeaminase-like protein [Typha latifolia]|uniref:formiminotransferase cyclodeaminase-like protein n=1 Tax=Typha latifolia TaxID=4733 RepID=UPI003C2E8169
MESSRETKAKKIMKDSKIICCKLYISESRNTSALEAIERASRIDPEAVIVNKFQDRAYNRVRYTLVSYVVHDVSAGITYSPMRQTLLSMVEAAFAAINLETHSGAHPRIGVVDHIGFHPLAHATLEDAAQLAKLVASDIGNGLQVPVFLYEAAHPNGKALDEIRRELGYYRPNHMGNQWAGWDFPEILPERPDVGPAYVTRARGITVIGASPWVDTYNVPVMSTDVPTVRRIARMVSARGGGLPTVQTLALVHGDDSTEITCMLLDPSTVGADRLQSQVELIAAEEGLEVEKGYFTDISQDMMLERYTKLVSSG